MTNIVSGKVHLALGSDPGGNYGYHLNYAYSCDKDDPAETIEYSDIEFSGPGSFDDFSEGGDYPYNEMLIAVLLDIIKKS